MPGPDVFGTVALSVRHSRYDARWQRAAAPAGDAFPAFVQAAYTLRRDHQAQVINAAMNQHVRYRYDAPRDNWASAGETMLRQAGDCEDIAIAKMQALLALGVPQSDLYMSIGRDMAARAVHAVLVVRLDGGFFVLDNRSDGLVPQEAFGRFEPILSFSGDKTWVHGYPVGAMPASLRDLTIAAASGRLQVGGLGSSTPRAHG